MRKNKINLKNPIQDKSIYTSGLNFIQFKLNSKEKKYVKTQTTTSHSSSYILYIHSKSTQFQIEQIANREDYHKRCIFLAETKKCPSILFRELRNKPQLARHRLQLHTVRFNFLLLTPFNEIIYQHWPSTFGIVIAHAIIYLCGKI